MKFLMSILKWQVKSFSNFELFFIVLTDVNFKVIHFLFWTKGSHQSPNFDTFKCFGENLPNVLCHFWKPQVSFSLNFESLFSVMEDSSSVLFSLKKYILWSQGAHWNTNFLGFRMLRSNFESFRGIMSHDTEEWSKLWTKAHFLFEKWHKKFDEF